MLLMIVGLLAMLFMIVAAFVILARADRQTLKLEGRGERVEQAVQATQDMLVKEIGGRSGTDLVIGANYAEIPGYAGTDPNGKAWGAPWLGSPEAIHNPVDTTNLPASYGYPALTGLGTSGAVSQPLTGLMVNSNDTNDPNTVVVQPGNPQNPIGLNGDTRLNAQQPFADADGDGIPDSSFINVAVATELANATGGRSVRASGIDPSAINYNATNPGDPGYANLQAWNQFTQNARYTAGVRIVSHGGMVSLGAPTDQATWNTEFTEGMFKFLQHPHDTGSFAPSNTLADRDLLWAMSQQSASVEPLLRRRGGLLQGYGEANQQWAMVPAALRNFERAFTATFIRPTSPVVIPGLDPGQKRDGWQRFNLADLNEWKVWRQAITLDPNMYNFDYALNQPPRVRQLYAPRQLLTTANYSDELARIESENFIKGPLLSGLGLPPGQLKYYLGAITDPNTGAFDLTLGPTYAHFLASSGRGFRVVRELANYFGEMLSGYTGWHLGGGIETEAVTLRQQAFMLAVNTVAFAAPRNSNGDIDTVYYSDSATGVYYAYVPQPFLTQLVAYNKPSVGPQGITAHIALALELYNPNDADSPPSARHDLNLAQFGISFQSEADPPGGGLELSKIYSLGLLQSPQYPLDDGRLDGRSFALIAINDNGANTWFEGPHPALPPGTFTVHGVLPAPVPYPVVNTNNQLRVKLWRYDLSGGNPCKVDEMEVHYPSGAGGHPPLRNATWYETVARDTRYESYLGAQNARRARWRMVMNVDCDPNNSSGDAGDPNHTIEPPLTLLRDLGSAPKPYSSSTDPATHHIDAAPCVPLYTANARPATGTSMLRIHGATRPTSFPTPGFLLYVPRVSHFFDGVTLDRKPVSTVLKEMWGRRSYSYTAPKYPPADFGHMPVFDNTQVEDLNNVGGFTTTKRIPWGLLAFDYFTTLDPNTEDPYHVPGRININTAPWHVLAGIPLIGPKTPTNVNSDLSALASSDISPAFWQKDSGVLTGVGTDGVTNRYPSDWDVNNHWLDRNDAVNGQWYRLGPYLAQAVTAYRDRTPYVSAGVLTPAFERNGGTSYYRDPNLGLYGLIRGSGATDRGFLSLGELANVIGFDGSTVQQLLSGVPNNTVLAGYGQPAYVGGDFMKAVSLLALLDTHFLTTRSNTFTVYTTLLDRETPSASVSSVTTVDRSNLLPRLMWQDGTGIWANGVQDPPDPTNPQADRYTVIQNGGEPEILARREFPYYGARYDE